MIEEYIAFFCNKADHIIQNIALSNEVWLPIPLICLTFACSLKIKVVCIGIENLILFAFDPLKILF
jgi:hypothetical protein